MKRAYRRSPRGEWGRADLQDDADPWKLSARTKRDLELKPEIQRVFAENFEVYGARKVWRQTVRENFNVARCTVERPMADLGLHGVIRGKPNGTVVQDKATLCLLERVNRAFHAPGPFIAVASCSIRARGLNSLHPLYRAFGGRRHREPAVGSVGHSYDNALADSISDLYRPKSFIAEERYYAMLEEPAGPRDSNLTVSGKPGAVHSEGNAKGQAHSSIPPCQSSFSLSGQKHLHPPAPKIAAVDSGLHCCNPLKRGPPARRHRQRCTHPGSSVLATHAGRRDRGIAQSTGISGRGSFHRIRMAADIRKIAPST